VVSGKVKLTNKKGQLMSQEEMVNLIQQVWSDAMSDNGSIWAKSNAQLEKAKADNADVYAQAMATIDRAIW
jgi:F420-dependent methylenetetrahydromethanopterin dehydrogenase